MEATTLFFVEGLLLGAIVMYALMRWSYTKSIDVLFWTYKKGEGWSNWLSK